METLVETVGNIAVLLVEGESLDASNSREFKRSAMAALQGHSRLVFDLSGLEFVDSSGLGAILSCLRQLNASGGDLKLCGMTKPVRALFELVRMHRIFDIFGTREDAIKSFLN
ncbi:MAG TPA: STAS domain-containing protein [Blastocatellia bacterium]|nr:STAS domain-containing protein [Blastocatellia bacterium]